MIVPAKNFPGLPSTEFYNPDVPFRLYVEELTKLVNLKMHHIDF
jgi:hypothetical protein